MYSRSGELDLSGRSSIKGTIKPQGPVSRHYDRISNGDESEGNRKAVTVKELVSIYLDGERNFTLTQYRYFFQQAKEYLRTVTYPTNEHKSLLRLAFVRYLNR